MKQAIITGLPWIMSALSLWMTVLAGNKKRSAWAVGLINQVLWSLWIALAHVWGLVPLTAALWVVYARNYMKWRKQ